MEPYPGGAILTFVCPAVPGVRASCESQARSDDGALDVSTMEQAAAAGPAQAAGDDPPAPGTVRSGPISTRLHGVLDYLTGTLLVGAPALLRLGYRSPAGRALWIAGTAHVGYSVLTDYELGAVKLIPMRTHLALDASGAVALATSPWLLETTRRGRRHWLPHLLLGVYELAAVAMSDPGG